MDGRIVLLQSSFLFFLRNSLLSSKLHKPHDFSPQLNYNSERYSPKIAPSALHCLLYSTLVTRSLRLYRYWMRFLGQKKRYSTAPITSVHGVVCAHAQLNGTVDFNCVRTPVALRAIVAWRRLIAHARPRRPTSLAPRPRSRFACYLHAQRDRVWSAWLVGLLGRARTISLRYATILRNAIGVRTQLKFTVHV